MKKEGGEGSYSKDMLRWDVEAWVRIANQRLASIKAKLQTPVPKQRKHFGQISRQYAASLELYGKSPNDGK